MARGKKPGSLSAGEAAMMAFARDVARDATKVTNGQIEQLKQHGFTDAEIFDIAATAAARAFWTKVLDALGVEADVAVREMDAEFRQALTVGRPIDFAGRQTMAQAE
jgi:alkylhydroperoxidase/carboxymuconolactone decarboxylase family protein YurZ